MVDHGGIYLIHKPTCAILFLHVSYGLTMVTTIKTYENTMFPGKKYGISTFLPHPTGRAASVAHRSGTSWSAEARWSPKEGHFLALFCCGEAAGGNPLGSVVV